MEDWKETIPVAESDCEQEGQKIFQDWPVPPLPDGQGPVQDERAAACHHLLQDHVHRQQADHGHHWSE